MNNKQIFDCCKGDVKTAAKVFASILRNQGELNACEEKVNIGNVPYDLNVLLNEIGIVMRIVQTEWIQIQNVVLYGHAVPYTTMIFSRELINQSFNAIIRSLELCNNLKRHECYKESVFHSLNVFLKMMVPFKQLSSETLLKLAGINNYKITCPIYHYLHGKFDIYFYILLLNNSGTCPIVLEEYIDSVVQDLITFCSVSYKKHLDVSRVFPCACPRYLWLIIQFSKEKTNPEKNSFWIMINKLMMKEEASFSLSLITELSFLQSFNWELMNENNESQRIIPNYELLESKLKTFLVSAHSKDLVKIYKMLDPLLTELWLKHAKIELYQIIWDYYSKRLNVSDKNYANLAAADLLKFVNTILHSRKKCNEDFELFISMLIVHLKEYPVHWGKIKGRIYSNLGVTKLKELNETGVTHIMLLFISLSSLYYEEAEKKILSLCEMISKENKSSLIWNVYMAFICEQVQQTKSLEKTGLFMVKLLEEAVKDNQKLYLVNDFFLNYKHILHLNARLDLYQWVFFTNTWLEKYLLTCYYPNLKLALEILLLLLEKLENSEFWPFWESTFKEGIYPALRKLSMIQNAPNDVGKICGKLYLILTELSADILIHFTSEHVSPSVSSNFIMVILDNYPNTFSLLTQQISLIVQSWVRISLLTGSAEKLTDAVLKLEVFPEALRTYIAQSNDSLFAFVEYLGSGAKTYLQSTQTITLCECLFGHLDKWLGQYLANPKDESIIFRIYTFMSLAFLHCGTLLYNRNKSSSPLTKLIQIGLLPNEFLMGKTPHIFILNAVKKTWHIFFEALVNLNDDSDMYLQRTIRDMVVKYMPYFPTIDSPMLKCLDNNKTACAFLEKISMCYCKYPVKESEPNILKVMKFLKNLFETISSELKMMTVIDKVLPGLLEIVISHSLRSYAIDVVKSIINSPLYPQVIDKFCNCILVVGDKHLPLNTNNFFQLMLILAKLMPNDIAKIMPDIKKKVSNVERLRGVGFDRNLRMHYEKLQSTVEEGVKK